FEFRAKSGKTQTLRLRDPRLARIVGRVRDLPGQELFQYVDEAGMRHTVGSADVNEYLREAMGEAFTAKDFRTWAATVLAAGDLCGETPPETRTEAKRRVKRTIDAVAARLGNTPAVCRKSYIHPEVLDAFADGRLSVPRAEPRPGLGRDEAAVLVFLRHLSDPAKTFCRN
ncbi:MAG: DNA topoisomerase IB, partial [Alphaproteobacteria bacterium]|nr:DNA topoisomerase IB [Alphaproteobacteria bacterium]